MCPGHPHILRSSATCESKLAVAVCSGAPCFSNGAADVLNVTCLCPVYKSGIDHAFDLAPNDVGHLGGCDAYDFDGGECALLSTESMAGTATYERRFAVSAVRTMTRAPRAMEQRKCRDWFGASDPSLEAAEA